MTMLTASIADVAPTSNKKLWLGRVLSGLAIAFLAFDTVAKLLMMQPAVDGTTELGFPVHAIWTIGLSELLCLVLYCIPRTAPLGAILWTGYFGGAIATHVRLDNPLFTHKIFPLYIAALIWGGLYLRDTRVRNLLRPEQ
jgi:hypothetical protein